MQRRAAQRTLQAAGSPVPKSQNGAALVRGSCLIFSTLSAAIINDSSDFVLASSVHWTHSEFQFSFLAAILSKYEKTRNA